jgi:hypothetical protein
VVYVGLKHIFQSTSLNGWTQIARAHDDQHVIEVNQHRPNELLIGSDGGVHRETWTPGDNEWSIVGLNRGLGTALFYAAAIASSNQALDPAAPWHQVAGGDGGAVAIVEARRELALVDLKRFDRGAVALVYRRR